MKDLFTVKYDATKSTITVTSAKGKVTEYPVAGNGSFDLPINMSNDVNSSGPVVGYLRIPVKATAPKLTTKDITTTLSNGFAGTSGKGLIEATGTTPISMDFSITGSDFQNVFPGSSDSEPLANMLKAIGITITSKDADQVNAGTAKIGTETGGLKVALKKFPINVTLTNPAGTATGRITLNVTGDKPEFVATVPTSEAKTSKMFPTGGNLADIATKLGDYVKVKGSEMLSITATGLPDGLTIEKGESKDGVTSLDFKGTYPTEAGKYNVTITATNSEGKATQKFVLEFAAALSDPTDVPYATLKTFEIGKAYSATAKFAGATSFDLVGVYAGAATTTNPGAGKPALDKATTHTGYNTTTYPFKVTMDAKGTITVSATANAVKEYPANSDGSFDILVHVSNDIPGIADVHLRVPIKTTAPKLTTKELHIQTASHCNRNLSD